MINDAKTTHFHGHSFLSHLYEMSRENAFSSLSLSLSSTLSILRLGWVKMNASRIVNHTPIIALVKRHFLFLFTCC